MARRLALVFSLWSCVEAQGGPCAVSPSSPCVPQRPSPSPQATPMPVGTGVGIGLGAAVAGGLIGGGVTALANQAQQQNGDDWWKWPNTELAKIAATQQKRGSLPQTTAAKAVPKLRAKMNARQPPTTTPPVFVVTTTPAIANATSSSSGSLSKSSPSNGSLGTRGLVIFIAAVLCCAMLLCIVSGLAWMNSSKPKAKKKKALSGLGEERKRAVAPERMEADPGDAETMAPLLPPPLLPQRVPIPLTQTSQPVAASRLMTIANPATTSRVTMIAPPVTTSYQGQMAPSRVTMIAPPVTTSYQDQMAPFVGALPAFVPIVQSHRAGSGETAEERGEIDTGSYVAEATQAAPQQPFPVAAPQQFFPAPLLPESVPGGSITAPEALAMAPAVAATQQQYWSAAGAPMGQAL